MHNYLDDNTGKKNEKLSIAQRISNTFHKKLNSSDLMTPYDRSYGIQKSFELHQKKDYKVETLFIAAGIFDRYINMLGVQNFHRSQVVALATISVLMSAKLE